MCVRHYDFVSDKSNEHVGDTREEEEDLDGESVVLVPNTAVVDMNVLSRNVKAVRVERSQVYGRVVPNNVS